MEPQAPAHAGVPTHAMAKQFVRVKECSPQGPRADLHQQLDELHAVHGSPDSPVMVLDVKNNADLFYDEALGPAGGSNLVVRSQ